MGIRVSRGEDTTHGLEEGAGRGNPLTANLTVAGLHGTAAPDNMAERVT
jgi:hypothetical protein